MSNCDVISEEEVKEIHASNGRAAVEGEEAFRLPWEVRSFALGVAYYESEDFSWTDFQSQLVYAIDQAQEGGKTEHYYARWVEALEQLLIERGGFDAADLDKRTQKILSTPRVDTHAHDHPHPTADHDHSAPVADHDHSHEGSH